MEEFKTILERGTAEIEEKNQDLLQIFSIQKIVNRLKKK